MNEKFEGKKVFQISYKQILNLENKFLRLITYTKTFLKIIKNCLKIGKKGERTKAIKFLPAPKIKNFKKYLDFKEGQTLGGSILSFEFHLLTFEPIRNFLISPKICLMLKFKNILQICKRITLKKKKNLKVYKFFEVIEVVFE